MLRWCGVADIPADWHDRCVVTIGVFDGVHTGHAEIIRRTVASARERGVPAVVITFDPHPSEIVRPGSHPALLATLERRAELLAELGVDALLVLQFTAERSRQTADDFVREVLVDGLHAVEVVVGENFRYGHRAKGNVDTLRDEGKRWGFTVDGVSLSSVAAGDQPRHEVSDEHDERQGANEERPAARAVSSTRVRALVAAGDVAAAARLLGRPHRVEGVVVRGDQRGRELGYPTANLECPPHTAIPADGVYAGWLVLDVHSPRQTSLPAAVSIGTNPTFGGTTRQVEAYALDRDDLELYGTHVAIEFVARVRDTLRFDSVEALLVRMSEDIKQVHDILAEVSS